MPYTPPNTFSASTTIASLDVQANLDGIKEYVDGDSVIGDYQTSTPWVEARHLMRGVYNAVTNQHTLLTGVTGGFRSHDEDMSWLSDAPTARLNPNDPDRVAYPNTGQTFYLEDTADVLFQFTGHPVSSQLRPSHTFSRVYLALDGSYLTNTKQWTTTHDTTAGHRAERQNWWHTFYLKKNLAAGWHSIQAVGYSQSYLVYLKNWSMSFEAYYL